MMDDEPTASDEETIEFEIEVVSSSSSASLSNINAIDDQTDHHHDHNNHNHHHHHVDCVQQERNNSNNEQQAEPKRANNETINQPEDQEKPQLNEVSREEPQTETGTGTEPVVSRGSIEIINQLEVVNREEEMAIEEDQTPLVLPLVVQGDQSQPAKPLESIDIDDRQQAAITVTVNRLPTAAIREESGSDKQVELIDGNSNGQRLLEDPFSLNSREIPLNLDEHDHTNRVLLEQSNQRANDNDKEPETVTLIEQKTNPSERPDKEKEVEVILVDAKVDTNDNQLIEVDTTGKQIDLSLQLEANDHHHHHHQLQRDQQEDENNNQHASCDDRQQEQRDETLAVNEKDDGDGQDDKLIDWGGGVRDNNLEGKVEGEEEEEDATLQGSASPAASERRTSDVECLLETDSPVSKTNFGGFQMNQADKQQEPAVDSLESFAELLVASPGDKVQVGPLTLSCASDASQLDLAPSLAPIESRRLEEEEEQEEEQEEQPRVVRVHVDVNDLPPTIREEEEEEINQPEELTGGVGEPLQPAPAPPPQPDDDDSSANQEQQASVDIQLSSVAGDDEVAPSGFQGGPSSAPVLKLDVSLAGRQRRLSVVFDDQDLEREFDEEPEFERRQVEVKRNLSPRDEYQLADELGRGRFGTVYRCREVATGRKLAAKFIHMRRKEDREDVEREVRIMSILQHKRLLQLYDAFDDGRLEMCLITELVEGGELFERIVDDDFELTEKKAAIFMRQICEGVAYMHSVNIVHLDMKPENILCLSRTGNRIKLIDFGLARQLNHQEPLRVMFGTPDFAAPEVLGYEPVTLATDMWSVGVICYVLLSGLSPFMGDNDMETMANVTRAVYDFDSQSFEPITELAKDFISKLLLRNATDRLKPDQCLQHAWLQRGGAQLEAAVRERRESSAMLAGLELAPTASDHATGGQQPGSAGSTETTPAGLVSLDKRNLKKYVVRRKWHKTVHAIMALGRMGAFKL